jgi:hypothetical protein
MKQPCLEPSFFSQLLAFDAVTCCSCQRMGVGNMHMDAAFESLGSSLDGYLLCSVFL